jgi:MFS family permease
VSLPHIAGNLSASLTESTGVLAGCLVANAVVLPPSGWLSTVQGRKRFDMACVVMFTLSSALCGMAPSLGWLVFFRVLQGVGGGGLQPSEQAILVDTFPPAKRGMAMAVYVPREQTNNASGLFNLIRNEGASIGVATATTLLERRTQAHQTWLVGHVTPFSPTATDALARLSALGWSATGDPVASHTQALRGLAGQVLRQAESLAYLDLFRTFAVAMLAVIPLVLLMRRSVASGQSVAAH